jgi:Mg-chelatase subunit ChlD
MSGPKLALLKRAMRFVIENHDPNVQLSIVAFSSLACRLFPHQKMITFGQPQLLQAVDSLVADGGTDSAEGVQKSARVVENRQAKNPVCSIIVLSDGVDSHWDG